ncbi:MAG TPA: TonB C-terminal domain-containing protein [Methylovirgula sp.]|nr:TonB C-terminal domain-containing protein [Methylovirgula sp.]
MNVLAREPLPDDRTKEAKGATGEELAPLADAGAPSRKNFWRRNWAYLAIGAVVLVAAGIVTRLILFSDNTPPPKQIRELTVVKIIPPPPPPPPPPPQQQPQPKMIEQPKMVEPEVKPDKPDDKPLDKPKDADKDEPPPGPLALDAKAEGPGDVFGLGGKLGGRGLLGGGGGGSRWGWYATIVDNEIEAALRENPDTRQAVMEVQVRIWADAHGRIGRVVLGSSTGDAKLDAALRAVLPTITLSQPPPNDMPMPIVVHITERKPS